MALIPNVAQLVDVYNVGPLTVHRPGLPAQNAYGAFVAAADATLTLDPVAVHTVTGRDLEQLPDADRTRETIQIYTRERLYVADGGESADRVDYRGRSFRVIQVQDFELQGGAYIALAQLEDPTIAPPIPAPPPP
jgi:hypothetical protein